MRIMFFFFFLVFCFKKEKKKMEVKVTRSNLREKQQPKERR